jgi:hypothetical protein
LKQRLIDHGGVLHENTRDLKEAERTDVFMASRPVLQEADGVPVILRAYLKRHGTVASPPAHDHQHGCRSSSRTSSMTYTTGSQCLTIVCILGLCKTGCATHFAGGQCPSGASAPDLSLANIEIGEEEIWWIRDPLVAQALGLAFVWQLKLSVPATATLAAVGSSDVELCRY